MDCVSPGPPSVAALFELSRLVPESPFSTLNQLDVQAHSEALKSNWRLWIETHDSELQKLKPTTKGITFDRDSCSKL